MRDVAGLFKMKTPSEQLSNRESFPAPKRSSRGELYIFHAVLSIYRLQPKFLMVGSLDRKSGN
jgi:hypothetical protein